jgi:hypothetical protein
MVFAKSLLVTLASCALLATSASAAVIKRTDDRVLVQYQLNPNFCAVWRIAWYVSCASRTLRMSLALCLLAKIVLVMY